MAGSDIIEQLLARHPRSIEWLGPLACVLLAVVAIPYAVIDKLRSKLGGNSDGLRERLGAEVSACDARHRCRFPVVAGDEFSRIMKLCTIMVLELRPATPSENLPPLRREPERPTRARPATK